MEGKSVPPDMISMSRPSRDNRASKNPKVTSDTSNPPPSKKSQIRASGTSPRNTNAPASKKAKTGGEALAGAPTASKIPEAGSGRTDRSSSNHSLRVVLRSKRAAENGGDVTLDALRPAKKRKISRESAVPSSPPHSSAGQVKSLKLDKENGKHTLATIPSATTGNGKAPAPDYALRNSKSGAASADATNTGHPAREINSPGGGGSAHQIGSRVGGTPNGLAGAAAEKRKELRALRPRPKPTAPKVKKRTRFHEVTLGDGDGPRIVGRRIKVFWPLEKKFFYGHVKAFNGARKLQHKIVYDDKDEEWLRLQNEVFGIELVPGEVFGGPASASATEASVAGNVQKLGNSYEHTGDAVAAATDGGAETESVEATGEGRIKPEGVYRRKRKVERSTEDNSQQLEGAIEQEKKPEGVSQAKKDGEGDGEPKKKGEGDGEPKEKTEGASESEIKLEKKRGIRKKGEVMNKQRRALAERLGRANAKQSSVNSVVRERRKRGVQVVTSRDLREKVLTAEGSSNRRNRIRKEKARQGSSVQTRARHSRLVDKEGKKTRRSRIRDDDRLFATMKSSSAAIRRKVAESKRSKEAKALRSVSDVEHSGQKQIEQKIAVEDENLISSFASNVRERKQAEDPSSTNQRANALGPFEAVMDAYLEALSGTKDLPSPPSNRGLEEEYFADAVREDDVALVGNVPLVLQDHDDEADLGEASDVASRLKRGASPSRSGIAAAASTLQLHEDRQQAGNEAESDLLVGEELSVEGGQRMSGGEVSTTEVVLKPFIPPVTRLRLDIRKSPDKVYRRVKKCQPDKVYRRLKLSRNKVHNEGFDEPADVPQIVVPVPQYWFLARPLPPAFHVLSYGARIAALGSSLQSFDRIAFSKLQCRSSTENNGLQLGTFYGAPSMQSLLRVSWKSLRWLSPLTSVSVNDVEDESLVEASPSVLEFKKSKSLHLSTANCRFKQRGMSSTKISRYVNPLRHVLDPTSDLKCLSFNTRYFTGLGVRSRRLGSVPRCSTLLVDAPPRTLVPVPQESQHGLVISSVHLTPRNGRKTGDLSHVQLVLSSDALRRALSVSNVWISRRRSPPIDVLSRSFEAGAPVWPVIPVTRLSGDDDRGCKEVGAYYGRRTLKSFLGFTKHEPMDVGRFSFTQSGDGAVAVDLSDVLMAVADMHGAGGCCDRGVDADAERVSRVGLGSSNLREENVHCTLSVGEGTVYDSLTGTHETHFTGPWVIDASAFDFKGAGSELTLPGDGGSIPRSVTIRSEILRNMCYPLEVLTRHEAESSVRAVEVVATEKPALEDSVLHAQAENTPYLPVMLDRGDTGGAVDLFTSAAKTWTEVPGGDLDINGQKIGMHYGSPSIESLLRVSKDFWLRLLVVQRKVQQPVNGISPTYLEEKLGALPRPQSSMEMINDDEVSDQEDRIQVIPSGGTGAADSSAALQATSVAGHDVDSIKAPAKTFGLLKKGRRTGKGLKRGLIQSGGDSLGRDSLGADGFQDGDLWSGRPLSKRTRLEIESSGAAMTRDNGVETSPPFDLDGKGAAAPSVLAQENVKVSAPPRVNVLKLRRCPTNKAVWLVAGNSCAAPQDTEASVPMDSSAFRAGGNPATPIFETSRKRVPDPRPESPLLGRSEQHTGNPAVATTTAVGNTVTRSGSQDLEPTASGVKGTKAFSLNANSPEVWYDCGITSINGIVPDGMDSRKRRRKGPSPIPGDDVDGISERSARRSADPGWGSCTANVLITKSDRCVRETGAMVELQLGHGNCYMLTVSLSGESKYALKADQPVASGTTNKFTHSMMWRGGKAWSLEFVDRKQWLLFKDLHEECFQRNARAASVRHIPIPGVKPIQESPKSGLRFVRPSHRYIRQIDGEVEMAFSSTRIIYDMDSEDEEWLDQVNNEVVSARGTRSRPKVDEDTFERVMDKLEKTSFIRQQDPFSAEVAAELCQPLGSQDVIKTIYSYWSEKRQRKGMALIRHFQPAPWEQYQHQLQEWQMKVDELQQQSPTSSKQQLQSLYKRPPLFAFCLRPRGLETRNKMQKQRSHRKQGLGGSSSRQWTVAGPANDFVLDSPSKRQPSVDSTGGPFYGSRKFVRQRIQEDNFSDPMAVDLTESFNALAGEGFTTLTDAGQAVSEGVGVVFPRVESGTGLQFETSTTGRLNKRTKKSGRKAKKMKLIAAAEETRRKRQLRAQQGHMNGRFIDSVQSPPSLSEASPFPTVTDASTSGISVTHADGQEEDKLAQVIAAEALAKAKREAAVTLRSRAQALHAVADAAMHKAVAAVIAADAIHAAERAAEEATEREKAQPVGTHRQQTAEVPVTVKDDLGRPWGRSEASGGGAAFGSWRRALNSASKNANHLLSKGSSSKPGLITDMDDALLPVAKWSQELGAGLGTRLLQSDEVSPQRQKYSPVLVEGLSKSPARAVRGEGLVSLGRTRGESMMAMLTR